jgi:energy-coupling factor transport system permease protein
MKPRDVSLDPRAWLAWAVAASFPATVGRNPIPLVATLVVVIAVREAWRPWSRQVASWSIIVRMAIIFSLVGIVFNVLTYHGGDREIFAFPDWLPIVGGTLTLNALIYGTLSGLALLTLVLVGTTVGALINWAVLLRQLPRRLTPIAVAGTVAFAFVPQTAQAFLQIREAQLARGHRMRGARDLVPLLVPLLTLGLERAITLSEAMESRGFGTPRRPVVATAAWQRAGIAIGLASAATAGYFLAVGRPAGGLLALAAGVGLFVVSMRGGETLRTSYRQTPLSRRDWLVLASSLTSLLVMLVILSVDAGSLRYEPYPSIEVPRINLALLVAIGVLLVPAVVVPIERTSRREITRLRRVPGAEGPGYDLPALPGLERSHSGRGGDE